MFLKLFPCKAFRNLLLPMPPPPFFQYSILKQQRRWKLPFFYKMVNIFRALLCTFGERLGMLCRIYYLISGWRKHASLKHILCMCVERETVEEIKRAVDLLRRMG